MTIPRADAIKLATYVLFMEGIGGRLTSSEIAERALGSRLTQLREMHLPISLEFDKFELASQIGLALSAHLRDTPAGRRVVVGNKNSGWEIGPRGPALLGQNNRAFATPRSAQHTGAVGEFAVLSELIACDWNATRLAVDDGIDIFAIKGQQTRTVQVKTAHSLHAAQMKFLFQIDGIAHEKYSGIHHYYVFVMRRKEPRRWINDFLILPSRELEEWRSRGLIQHGDERKWSMALAVTNQQWTLKGEGELDVSSKTNDFHSLFV